MIEEENQGLALLERAIKHLEEEKIISCLTILLIYCRLRKLSENISSFKKILDDLHLRRSIGFIDKIKETPQTAIEYFDSDKNNDPYMYDETTERAIVRIKYQVSLFIADALEREQGISIEEFVEGL